ncbi:MAG: type I restriction enzyme HsdR N-terminal domain-containing protein [Cyclobacteriaceae bacterium]
MPIHIPEFKPTVKAIDGKTHIWDDIRKKYLVLTPEELVRQSLINHLIKDLNYPKSLISVEKGVRLGKKINRSDIHVLSKEGKCFLLIECKSFKEKIDVNTMHQVAKYNATLKADFIAVSNGLNTYCFKINQNTNSLEDYEKLPDYPRGTNN